MYVIRADGNASIGVGHLMRCLTITDALVAAGTPIKDIVFICAQESSAMLVKERGYGYFVCETDYTRMEEELSILEAMFSGSTKKQIFLVDSYYVTDYYLQELHRWGKVILLDDMQQHAFPVDAVVNYNAFASKEIYDKLYADTDTECHVGATYVPVRPQFLNVSYAVKDTVSNVLITTGGGDQDNIAGQILEQIYDEKLNYHLITGRFNPHLVQLKKLERRGNVKISYDVKDMASCMKECDIAITAGGTTIYELAAVGVPFICFSYAENQEALTEYVGAQGIAGYAGAYHKYKERTLQELREQFAELCASQEKRNTCYEKEKTMIDGQGADRLATIWSEMNRMANPKRPQTYGVGGTYRPI